MMRMHLWRLGLAGDGMLFQSGGSNDHKRCRLFAPSTARNRVPILGVLQLCLPERGPVLEVASGTGEHSCFFAAASGPELLFKPSDIEADNRASIDAWSAALDLAKAATECLIRGAARVLEPGGFLDLYGPFRRDGGHTAPSNAGFDDWLKSQSPEYGVRDLEVVAALASLNGFGPPDVIDMPANNFSVVMRR